MHSSTRKRISVFLFALAFLIVPKTAYAVDDTDTSHVTVTFEAGGSTDVGVVDPEDPTEIDDTKPPVPPGAPLALIYVSAIEFGTQPIPTSGTPIKSISLKPFVQITDSRGSLVGWKLTAQLGPFTKAGVESLPGSILHLTTGNCASASATNAQVLDVNDDVELVAGLATASDHIATAILGKGGGTWVARWIKLGADTTSNSKITLEVPSSLVTTGVYTAVLTWTLADAPS